MSERRVARSTTRSGARPRVDPVRLAAFDVLKAVRVEDAYANLVLPTVLRAHGLVGRDAAFATELACGTLRCRGFYDAILASCADRPLSKIEAKVLDALRLGAHQLLSMRVPDHAAINTTVDLVVAKASAGAGGFANAVLRRAARHDSAEWVTRVAPDSEIFPTRYAAVAYSHPTWVVDELRDAVGVNELLDLLGADNLPPRVTMVAWPGRSSVEELPGTRTDYSPYGVVLERGDPHEVRALAEGRAGVQDEGSQLVALALAAADPAGPDRAWLDMCAGPGGKAALLASLAAQRAARLVAAEMAPHRARLVRRAVGGAASAANGLLGVLAADGTRPPFRPTSFDRVLVDAPCTGLGALRRRPEARWRRKPQDLLQLVMLQRTLLASALDLTRSGGVVLYATCSPVLAETATVVRAVIQERSDAELEDVSDLLPGVPDCEGPLPGTVQLWPHRHGTDAMFMALFRKR